MPPMTAGKLLQLLSAGAFFLLAHASEAQTTLPVSCGESEGIVGLHRGADNGVVVLCRDQMWGWNADLDQANVFRFGQTVDDVAVGPSALLFAIWSDTLGVTDGARAFESPGVAPRPGMKLAPSNGGIFLFGGEPAAPPHIVYELASSSEPAPIAILPQVPVDVAGNADTLFVASQSGVYRQIDGTLEPYFGVDPSLTIAALDRTPSGSLLLAVGAGVLEVAPGGGGARWVHRGPADDVLWTQTAIYVLHRTEQRITVVKPLPGHAMAIVSDDPVSATVLLHEDFADPSRWLEDDGPPCRTRNAPDGYSVHNVASSGSCYWNLWYAGEFEPSVRIDAVVALGSGPVDNGYGINFGTVDQQNSDYYTFMVSGDGHYQLGHWNTNEGWTQAVAWQEHDAVNTGVGATNRLTVEVRGDVADLYVNNRFVHTYRAPRTLGGYLALYVAAPDIQAVFKDLRVETFAPIEVVSPDESEVERLNEIVGWVGGRFWIEEGFLFYEGRRDGGRGRALPRKRGQLQGLDPASVGITFPPAVEVRCKGPEACIFSRQTYSEGEVELTRLLLHTANEADARALGEVLRAFLSRF